MSDLDPATCFAETVIDGVPGMLAKQQTDGRIEHAGVGMQFNQQAIMPLTFAWAGLDPQQRCARSPLLLDAIRRLGAFLHARHDKRGRLKLDLNGYAFHGVDQRLVFAWLEAWRMLRAAGADIDYDAWREKILLACEFLVDEKLRALVGARRFIVRNLGTGTNHVALYLSTVYRAGETFGRADLRELALGLARAFASDVHPDGYWEEHSDLRRTGGPTTLYNYLSLGGVALMRAWTGEHVFADAEERGARFHARFCWPDATPLELIDERVRHHRVPATWGLFAFSGTAEGRGAALRHFAGWRASLRAPADAAPEALARMCENHAYWRPGAIADPPFARADLSARLTLPAGIWRRGAWTIALSAMRATTHEDATYRGNPFALDRQCVLGLWHERAGMVVDGSHSKDQPEASSFRGDPPHGPDHLPCGGDVAEDGAALVARADYRTFAASARVACDGATARITLSADHAALRGPIVAGFQLARRDAALRSADGAEIALGDATVARDDRALGGAAIYGPVRIAGDGGWTLHWPLKPFFSYRADHVSDPSLWQPRVETVLTAERPSATFTLTIA